MTQQSGQINPGSSYVVREGDTLSSIAQQAYGNGSQPYWMALFIANKIQASSPGPNAIKAGDNLTIPPITNTPQIQALYIVKQGDTLKTIALQAYNDGSDYLWEQLRRLNRSAIGGSLQPGQVLCVPDAEGNPMGGK